MTAALTFDLNLPSDASSRLAELGAELAAGRRVPYLGPRVIALEAGLAVPASPEGLALELHRRSPVSGRLRSNMWASAQFIESRKHRKTLTAYLRDIFRPEVKPQAFHRALASLPLPLIVDVWYDAAMRTALIDSGRTDWGEIQGSTRAGEFREIWTKAYDATGTEVPLETAATWTTVLYKPHGSIAPAGNFLVSDSDYVEVLTEIDIQSPIPAVVKERRQGRPFLFLGARFHDQMLRTFARQIAKRSADGHVAVVDAAELTRNETRFLGENGIEALACPLALAVGALGGK
jgi:hypothetical protein